MDDFVGLSKILESFQNLADRHQTPNIIRPTTKIFKLRKSQICLPHCLEMATRATNALHLMAGGAHHIYVTGVPETKALDRNTRNWSNSFSGGLLHVYTNEILHTSQRWVGSI